MEEARELLKMEGITKIYGNGVLANSQVNFSVKKGEIHALMGENGAGKSTLMKILFGIEQPDEGRIEFEGRPVKITSPNVALSKGIGMVHQHFKLIPSLTVAENIVLGKEPVNKGFINIKKAYDIVSRLSQKYGFNVDPTEQVKNLSVGKKQKVEILKALYRDVRLLILDEPTAVLTPQETGELFEQLEKLRKSGLTIVFISHKLNEIKQICQNITVMRHGRSIGTYDVGKLSVQDISKLMVGRDIILKIQKKEAKPENKILEVKSISAKNESGKKVISDISFAIRAGEILGIAGVEGSGQEEIVEMITGMKRLGENQGDILLNGKTIKGCSIKEIRNRKLSYIPEDRMVYGAACDVSIRENLISSIYDTEKVNSKGFLDKNKMNRWIETCIKDYDVRCKNVEEAIGTLSGGNIQKAIIAREFLTNPSVLVADQPTRGVDVGAIEFIHRKIVEIRDKGCAVLLVSADLNEILELSDSILVMCQGEISGYFPSARELTEEELGYYMLGVKKQAKDEVIRRMHS